MEVSAAAVVVTYNRKALLNECLEAILSQSHPVERIILIDNASTDGTKEMLRTTGLLQDARMQYVRMETNTGGSGGFYEGLRIGRECGCDWLWLMDDDTVPAADCLEKLLLAQEILSLPEEDFFSAGGKASGGIDSRREEGSAGAADVQRDALPRVSFLASCVYGPGGECMNVPKPDRRPEANGSEGWYRRLSRGLLQIESATFVSILVRTDAVCRVGLPCREYFIWGDDVEYTNRLTHYYGKAYLVGSSTAIHKRANPCALNLAYETDPERIRLFHYDYRNQAINNRFYHKGMGTAAGVLRNLVAAAGMLRRKRGLLKAGVILKGTIEALAQYPKFRRYIENELRSGMTAGVNAQNG